MRPPLSRMPRFARPTKHHDLAYTQHSTRKSSGGSVRTVRPRADMEPFPDDGVDGDDRSFGDEDSATARLRGVIEELATTVTVEPDGTVVTTQVLGHPSGGADLQSERSPDELARR